MKKIQDVKSDRPRKNDILNRSNLKYQAERFRLSNFGEIGVLARDINRPGTTDKNGRGVAVVLVRLLAWHWGVLASFRVDLVPFSALGLANVYRERIRHFCVRARPAFSGTWL